MCELRVVVSCLCFLFASGVCSDDRELETRVLEVLSETPLIDGHNDLPYAYTVRTNGQLDAMPFTDDLTKLDRPTHTDLNRLRAGPVGGQFWSVYSH